MKDLLADLNPPQREAVVTTEGPLLILAGAGSGKTRVLTRRMAYLVQEKGVAPERILAITFTNKAAREMKERVEALVGLKASAMWVSTFHSACVRILRREISLLGYDENFNIYDPQDQESLLREVLKELNLDEKNFPPKSLLAAFSRAKNYLLGPEDLAAQAGNWREEKAAEIFAAYQERLKASNALDFDDILMLTVDLFERYPDVLEKYRNFFRYIMVDEYQDTNHAQYRLIRLLSATHRNLCVVGDDDQSIYGWRGADVQNILDFEKDYPEAKIIRLEQNYRSTRTILEAANAVVACNLRRKPKRLWTENDAGAPVVAYRAATEWDEAFFVAEEILRLQREEGYPFRAVAVLYRTNAQSRVLEETFLRQGIPYRLVGALRFYERKEIKDLLAYLRLLVNPRDELSFRRLLLMRKGVGTATVDRLVEFARSQDMPFTEALIVAERAGVKGKVLQEVRGLSELLQRFADYAETMSIGLLVDTVLEESGLLAEYDDGTAEGRSRRENLQEFLSVVRGFESQSEEKADLATFMAAVSLMSDVDTLEEGGPDAVTLMTFHSAKGLEFPVVFMAGMEENLFPTSRASFSQEEMEEERRLCYVGITRAKERLYLTLAATRLLYGRAMANPPSRFLGEIPDHLICWLNRPGTGVVAGEKVEKGEKMQTTAERGTAQWQPGQKVEHAKWGPGVIVGVQEEKGDIILTVAFPNQGIKKLLASLAPLRLAGGEG